MEFALILDVMISVLLVVTIVYAVVLNRRLKSLRAGEAEMRSAIERFNASAELAEANLARIKDVATSETPSSTFAGGNKPLEPLVAEARHLAADLNLLIERGESVISRTQTAAPSARAVETTAKPLAARDLANPQATWAPGEDLDLADALKGVR